MRIDRLQYFIEVANKGSINLSCETLHISQQALSQAIQSMEKEIGYELFTRTRKGVSLTAKGREFYYASVDIVKRWEDLVAKLNEDTLKGTLRISFAPLLEGYYYTLLLDYIEKYNFDIQIAVSNLTADEAATALEEDIIDIAVVSLTRENENEFLQEHPTLNFYMKKQFNSTLLISRHSDLAKKSRITSEDLTGQRVVVEKTTEINADVFQRFLECNPMVDVVFVNSFEAKQEMVARNLGCTLGIENGPILNRYYDDFIEIPLPGYAPTLSGILYPKEGRKEKILKEIEKAW